MKRIVPEKEHCGRTAGEQHSQGRLQGRRGSWAETYVEDGEQGEEGESAPSRGGRVCQGSLEDPKMLSPRIERNSAKTPRRMKQELELETQAGARLFIFSVDKCGLHARRHPRQRVEAVDKTDKVPRSVKGFSSPGKEIP